MIRAQLPSGKGAESRYDALANSGPELTPLIDIIFIVVVFLLLTANARILTMPVDIPDTESKAAQAAPNKQTLSIAIHAEAPIWQVDYGDNKPTPENQETYSDWPEFKNALLSANKTNDLTILIAPDAEADAEMLVKLLALLNEEGLNDAHILMEPE